ncbi:ATP-dependent DNA helicase RecG [Methanomicrobium sp. W14]|uniref:RNA-binding domain-containing protein n=1 Tax=Methanomicrobium sp. W14 TaxID=2817839 RepID=UPI001AE8773A|nr:RNA-binding domain-containing protein [Methanomicrobium sp. W14]MBP2133988.1 ATP-dependent DNA helicase RecG [Methanomicrobium sp. W14]
MERDNIIALLGKHEWNDLEFKKGQRGVPAETYKTVSAFANTKGGWIIFGIKDENGSLEPVGVLDVDSVQNDFLGVLRSRTKFNHVITCEEELFSFEDKDILAFFIPESPRNKKPVFLNGNWSECYIRSGGCSQKCTEEEVKRFVRDSSDTKYDNEPLFDIDSNIFYDEGSVQYYRNLYNYKNPGRSETLNDVDFLSEFGFLVEKDGKLAPTRAGVLIFGKDKYVRLILNNRIVVDYQRIDLDFDDWSSEVRWHDRVAIESNLIQAWIILAEKYHRMADRPFSVDKISLRRNDEPADYISFREATMNLLIHQDYGDHGRKASIKFYKNRTVFWNPGDSYTDEKELLETTEKEVRNPSIVSAFRRIGMSEQAGSGVPSIFNNWRELGNVPPVINNYKDKKAFELILLKDKLFFDDIKTFQKETGFNLSDDEARVFVLAVKRGSISLVDVRAVTGKKWRECQEITEKLVKEDLIVAGNDNRFQLSLRIINSIIYERIKKGIAEDIKNISQDDNILNVKAGEEAIIKNNEILTETEYKVLLACQIPRSLKEILEIVDIKSRSYLREKVILSLIEQGLIKMMNPQKPNSPKQKYAATEKGMGYIATKKQ